MLFNDEWNRWVLMEEEAGAGGDDGGAGGGAATAEATEVDTSAPESDNTSAERIPSFFEGDEYDTEDNPSSDDNPDGDDAGSETEADDAATGEQPSGNGHAKLPEITPELQQRAAVLGFTLADYQRFGTPEALAAAVDTAERVALTLMEYQQAQAQQAGQQQQNTTQQPQQDSATQAVNQSAAKIQALRERIEKLRDDGYSDEDLASRIEMLDVLETQHQSLVTQMEQINQFMQQSQQERVHRQREVAREQATQALNEFDRDISSLPPEYESLLGKGPTTAIDRTSPQFANRDRVLGLMRVIAADAQQRGLTMTREELKLAAVSAAFPTQAHSIARNELRNKLKTAGSQTLAKPARSSQDPALSPEEKAFTNFEQGLRRIMRNS